MSIPIFEAPTALSSVLATSGVNAVGSIADAYQSYKKQKNLKSLSETLATQAGDKKLAPLFAKLAQERPQDLLKHMQLQQLQSQYGNQPQSEYEGIGPNAQGFESLGGSAAIDGQMQGGGLGGMESFDPSMNGMQMANQGMPNQLPQMAQQMPQQSRQQPGIAQRGGNMYQTGNNLPHSPQKIEAYAVVDPQRAARLQQENTLAQQAQLANQRLEEKRFDSDRNYHTKLSDKARESAEVLRESLPKKEMALDLARRSVESGDVKEFSKNRLAETIGGPIGDALKTASGTELTTAGKENLLSNMSRVSSRGQNQWFEQRLNSMFPKIGHSKEANLAISEMLEGEAAMDRAYLNAYDRLESQDMQQNGYVKGDIAKRARKEVEPANKMILQRTTYRLKEQEESEKGYPALRRNVGKKVVKGTPLTVLNAKAYLEKYGSPEIALKAAEQNGYTVPSKDEIISYRASPQENRENL